MMEIEVECSFCGKKFKRDKNTVNYRKKLGMRIYCSLKCVGKQNNSQLEKPPKGILPPNLVQYNTFDTLSPFRMHMRGVRHRKRKECSITIEDLVEQWNKQAGVCPITGWTMDNTPRSRSINSSKLPFHIKRASLDRIDSSKGYTKDNIQFICLIAQYAKNQFKEKEVLEFCEATYLKAIDKEDLIYGAGI